MPKKVRVKRPSRFDELTLSTKQGASHLHSETIRSERDLLEYESNQLSERMLALQAAMKKAQERAKIVQAKIVGLNLVLEKR